MKIQYCSDLHLEFRENKEFLKKNPLKPMGDILLLAGDIVPFAIMNKHEDFFNYIAENFKITYWIPGNHEYYYYDIAEKQTILNEKIRDNIFLVNNIAIQQDHVRFIFSTLWSIINPEHTWSIQQHVSDFHVIKFNKERLFPVQFNELHRKSLSFLKNELNRDYIGNTIVVTHHVPTLFNYPEKYKGSELSDAFVVELYDFIAASHIDYWIFGHHHDNMGAFTIGKTNMLTNQLGYVRYNENEGFDNKTYIDINNFDNQYNKAIFAQ